MLTETAPTPPTPQPSSLVKQLAPKLIISLMLGALFAWLVARGGVPLIPPKEAFQNVAWWSVPAYALVWSVTHFFRASRWRFLVAPIKKLSLKDVVALNWIGFFAIFALPLRLGEIARPTICKARHGIPISAGFGTIAVERVLDGLLMSLCVAWALFALPRQPATDQLTKGLPFYGILALVGFSSALFLLLLFLWQRALAARLIGWTVGLVSKRLGAVLTEKIHSVADGVRSLAEPKLAAGFIAESLIYWALNAGGMVVLAWGIGLPLDMAHAVAVMGILALGILLPAGPGLFGNFQLAVSLALKLYFPESVVAQAGAVFIFLMYLTQATVIIMAGIIPLYAFHIPFRSLLKAE